MRRASTYLILMATTIAILGLIVLLPSPASAVATDNTWIATTGSSANVAGSWENGSLVAGQNIWFKNTANGNCAWNVAITLGNVNIKGYSGVITQGAVDFGYNDFTMTSGTWTGVTTQTQTIAGNMAVSAGTYTTGVTSLKVTGAGMNLATNQGLILSKLWITGTVTLDRTAGTYNFAAKNIIIDSGAVVSIPSGRYLYMAGVLGYGFTNNGTINGPGTMRFGLETADCQLNIGGTINAPIEISGNGETASHILTLQAPLSTTSTLTLSSTSAYTATLNTADHDVTANGITLGLRGVLIATGSDIINNGNWDSSSGTWTPGTSIVNMIDSNKTVKLASGQSFNKLNIIASGINPKWQLNGVSGTVYWNVTSLASGRDYNLYIDGVIQIPVTANSGGKISFSRSTWSTHTYELREVPLVSPVPVDSSSFTRHQVDEGILYSVNYTSDQVVTWTIDGPSWLVVENGWVHGRPGYDDQGTYTVTVTATNANGQRSVSFPLEVNDTRQPTDFGPMISLGIIMVFASILAVCFGNIKWRK